MDEISPNEQTHRALGAVRKERIRQDMKWGDQSGHPHLYWLGILMEEVGEVAKEIIESTELSGVRSSLLQTPGHSRAALRKELVQVAAVATAWIEKIDKETA